MERLSLTPIEMKGDPFYELGVKCNVYLIVRRANAVELYHCGFTPVAFRCI
jgi:hypothetical protein